MCSWERWVGGRVVTCGLAVSGRREIGVGVVLEIAVAYWCSKSTCEGDSSYDCAVKRIQGVPATGNRTSCRVALLLSMKKGA